MNFLKNSQILVYILIVTVFIAIRVFDINRPLWNDEIISIKTTKINFWENPLYNGTSTNLPLYYYILKIGSLIGLENQSLRYVSAFISVVTLIFILSAYHRTKSLMILIFLIVFTISPLQIYYSQEMRTYILSQLLLVILTNILFKIENKQSINLLFIGFTVFLALISHYTSFIFIASMILYLTFTKKWDKKLIVSFVIPISLALMVFFSISQNKNFDNSLEESVVNLDFSKLSLFDLRENVLRTNELLTIYYNFGLHYYRVEPEYLGFFKKFMYFNFLLFGFLIVYLKKYKNHNFLMLLSLFGGVILISILMDMFGFMDFGGRYQFPFHFLFLLGIAYYLKLLFNFNKVLFALIFSVFIGTYLLSDFCLWKNLDIFVGTGDPQGILFSKCYEKVFLK